MKKSWKLLGVSSFWLLWPGLFFYLRWSKRTRVLIMSGDKVLVVKSWLSPDQWGLPGGGLHKGEKPVEGAIREVQEETGITLKPKQLQVLQSGLFKGFGMRFHYDTFLVTLPEIIEGTITQKEIAEMAWTDWRTLTPQNAQYDVVTALAAWSAL